MIPRNLATSSIRRMILATLVDGASSPLLGLHHGSESPIYLAAEPRVRARDDILETSRREDEERTTSPLVSFSLGSLSATRFVHGETRALSAIIGPRDRKLNGLDCPIARDGIKFDRRLGNTPLPSSASNLRDASSGSSRSEVPFEIPAFAGLPPWMERIIPLFLSPARAFANDR